MIRVVEARDLSVRQQQGGRPNQLYCVVQFENNEFVTKEAQQPRPNPSPLPSPSGVNASMAASYMAAAGGGHPHQLAVGANQQPGGYRPPVPPPRTLSADPTGASGSMRTAKTNACWNHEAQL